MRSNLDGSNIEIIVYTSGRPQAIDVDPVAGYVYYSTEYGYGPTGIWRANIATGAEQLLASPPGSPYIEGVALRSSDTLYFGDWYTGEVWSMDANTGNILGPICGSSYQIGDIELDIAGGRMYVADWYTSRIGVYPLDGGTLMYEIDPIQAGSISYGLALDLDD
jgi:hypothetical protein